MSTTDRDRLAAWAGIVGPPLFVLIFTLEGLLRPNYSARRMFISELSLGARGWVQIANFVLFGILLLTFARGIARSFKETNQSQVGPGILTIVAISFALSGPFVTDPGTIFAEQRSWHGLVHGILGAMVFVLMPVSCFVFLRSFRRDHRWQPLDVWTFAAGIVIAGAVILLRFATELPEAQSVFEDWLGLIQRTAIVPYMLWLVAFALRYRTNLPSRA